MTARRRIALAALLVTAGAAGALAAPWLADRIQRGPRGTQRPLAGSAEGIAGDAILPGAPRVVLIEGRAAADADASPAWRTICGAGRAFTVDVGFPTRSLPVQGALWTGLTATQLGLYVNLPRGVALAPDAVARQLALPARIAGSLAVV